MSNKLQANEDPLFLEDETEGSKLEIDVYYNSPVDRDYISIIATNEAGDHVYLNLPPEKLLEIQKHINERVVLLANRSTNKNK